MNSASVTELQPLEPDTQPEAGGNNCPHENFQPVVTVKGFRDDQTGENLGWQMSVNVFCADCTLQFEFVAPDVPVGMGWGGPRRSVDSTVLTLPFKVPGTVLVEGLPSVDLPQRPTWGALRDEDVEALIRRAMQHPGSFTMLVPRESPARNIARAIRVALSKAIER